MIADDIRTGRLVLSALDVDAVTDRYLNWMTNPRVTEFTESRFSVPTLDDLRDFVRRCRESADSYLFSIVLADSGEHVGNIKLGPVNAHHRRAAIGIIIGEESAWGKGIATEAVGALSGWAFETLDLEKLIAGIYASNVGSLRAFEKAGFTVEGRQVSEVVLHDGQRGDSLILGKVRNGS